MDGPLVIANFTHFSTLLTCGEQISERYCNARFSLYLSTIREHLTSMEQFINVMFNNKYFAIFWTPNILNIFGHLWLALDFALHRISEMSVSYTSNEKLMVSRTKGMSRLVYGNVLLVNSSKHLYIRLKKTDIRNVNYISAILRMSKDDVNVLCVWKMFECWT